eukprot:4551779-Amphidinium_carterae.2
MIVMRINSILDPRTGRDMGHCLPQDRPGLSTIHEALHPHNPPSCSPRTGRESENPPTPASRLCRGNGPLWKCWEGCPRLGRGGPSQAGASWEKNFFSLAPPLFHVGVWVGASLVL